jgi:hypothetical protein
VDEVSAKLIGSFSVDEVGEADHEVIEGYMGCTF